MREGKVYAMEWPQHRHEARSYTFKGTANKLGNTIPLNETVMDVLHEIKRRPSCCSTRSVTTRSASWRATASASLRPRWLPRQSVVEAAEARQGLGDWVLNKETGVEEWQGFTFHGLRHTFATWLDTAGVPPERIDQLGGWKVKGSSRLKYTHNVEALRPYAAVIDRILERGEVCR
jgi:integrase